MSSIGRGIGQHFSVWRAWRKWCRGDVGGWAPPLEEKVRMDVESRGKILGWVTRGEESESDVGVGVTLEVRLHRFKKS